MHGKPPFLLSLSFLCLALGCVSTTLGPTITPALDREDSIPSDRSKIAAEADRYPVQSLTGEYADPVPLPYPVNTAGAEDSAYMMPDGQTLYVWFTPDSRIPPEKQLLDGVTGIYEFHRTETGWSAPERLLLQDPGKLSLDGCGFVQNQVIWFCAAREGYDGMQWFTAKFSGDRWGNFREAGFPPEYEVGELHITGDGRELYYHSAREGGLGGYDIWRTEKVGGEWQSPVNLLAVNSEHPDGWPYISPDGKTLWLTRIIGGPELWRSTMIDGEWGPPVRMFAPFAGEASLDADGNVIFTHHFFRDNQMLEANIYIAHRLDV